MRAYSREDGQQLVKAARHSIELFLKSPHFDREMVEKSLARFDQKHGVFVTLKHYPSKVLRGYTGFSKGRVPVKRGVVEAAISAATEDNRFVPVSHLELEDHLIIEVSVLSRLDRVRGTPASIKAKIKAGEDGLMVEYGYYSGILLPHLHWEEGAKKEELLEKVCLEAGLSKDAWKRGDIYLYKFTTQTFREVTPNGPVEEIGSE